jgi:hypothetical protein
MTIQENNAIMQRQLLNVAAKCRQRYTDLIEFKKDSRKQQLAIENLTRAIHFENIAHNLLKV